MIESYLIYNVIALGAILLSYFKQSSSRGKGFLFLLTVLVLFLPAALRQGIGRDYDNYYSMYTDLNYWSDYVEPGFKLLIYALQSIELPPQSLFIVTSLLTTWFALLSFDKKYVWVSLVIFLPFIYLPSYSIVRQALAVCLVMYACRLWIDNYKIKSLLVLAISACFHSSTILVIPVVLFSGLVRFTSRKSIIIAACLFVGVFVLNLPDVIFNNSFFLSSPYGRYVESQFNSEGISGSGVGAIIRLLLPLIIFLYADRILEENKRNNILIALALCYVCALLLSFRVYIFARLVDTFSFSIIMLAPLAMHYSKSNKILRVGVLCTCLFYLVTYESMIYINNIESNNITNSGLGITPYKSIIE